MSNENNKNIEILFHNISYYLEDGSSIEVGDSEYEHIVYMINEGYSSGELNRYDQENDIETRGWWSIENKN